MKAFNAIDLSRLPPPAIIESLDYQAVLAELKADFIARAPEQAAALAFASEPAAKILESAAYTLLTVRQRINDAGQAVMLAYAQGADLDQLAGLFGVQRQVIHPGDLEAQPPVPARYEDDDRLRQRVTLSLEGYTTAGSAGSYVYWSLSAHADIRDVRVQSLTPGQVTVTVLGADDPTDEALLQAVRAILDDKRPLTDQVIVQGATRIPFQVKATLTLLAGPDANIVKQAAHQSVVDYVQTQYKLGRNIPLSGLYAALHQSGVQQVVMASPTQDVDVPPHGAPWCTAIDIHLNEPE